MGRSIRRVVVLISVAMLMAAALVPLTATGAAAQTTPPNTVITNKHRDTSNLLRLKFQFSGQNAHGRPVTFECSLDDGAFATCTSPYLTPKLADGPHHFQVRAITNGVQDPTPASFRWTIDTKAPTVVIDSHPTDPSQTSDATFTFHASEVVTVHCVLDGGPVACDSSGYHSPDLAQGAHTFVVRVTDAAGNTGSDSRTWNVDSVPPDVSFHSGPRQTTSARRASFTWTLVDPDQARERPTDMVCTLDGAASFDCDSAYRTPPLAEGPHTFTVQATDAAGNADPSPAIRKWIVDATPPSVLITGGDRTRSADNTPTFEFTSDDPTATFTCQIDDSTAVACSSPYTAPALADGHHTITIHGEDACGNVNESSAALTIDTTGPTAVITGGPQDGDTDATPKFTYTTEPLEGDATFICAIDSSGFAPCASPYTSPFALPDGPHTFKVIAIDPLGNKGPAATLSWTLGPGDGT